MNAVWLATMASIMVGEWAGVTALSVQVPATGQECYIVHAKVGSTISGSFEILTPDPRPVQVKVMGPEPTRVTQYEMVYSGAGAVDAAFSEGNFLFDAETEGDYTLCLRNGDESTSDGISRLIAFNFRSKDHTPGEHDYENIEMESELSDLINGLNFLRDHQHYMNERESIHRGTLDKIKYKFVVWSLVEYGLLIMISLWQIHSILVFFETKRKV